MDVCIVNPIAATPDLTASALVHAAVPSTLLPASALSEVNIVETGAALAALGHRVTLVLGSAYLGDERISLGPRLTLTPVHTLMPFPFHPGLLPMTPELARLPALREADIVQSGEFHQPSTFFAAKSSIRAGIPFVLWQETFGPMRFPGSVYQRGFEMTCGPTIRAAVAKGIPRTSRAHEYLRRLRLREDSIAGWIPTGIDLAQFAPGHPKTTPEEFGWDKDSEVLLLVARLNASKGVDQALHVLERLRSQRRDVRLLVRGSGPQETALRSLARDLGVSESVRFVPRVPRARMVDLYRLSEVVLSTSRSDLLPFALMEASACGRPVVAMNVGAVSDIVVDSVTGSLVPQQDLARFAGAVAALLDDEEKRTEAGRAARARAEAAFDVRVTAQRLAEVYHGVAG